MPNQKLLAEYCIPNLLANVQPIHHAWPNKIQTMDCLLSKKNTGWIYVYLWRQSPKIILKIYGYLWTKTTATCPSSIKWFARKFSSIKWIDYVISGSTTLCINWTGPCPSSIKWFARKFSSIRWLGWCISWLYKMLCRNFLSTKCPGCSTNSSS